METKIENIKTEDVHPQDNSSLNTSINSINSLSPNKEALQNFSLGNHDQQGKGGSLLNLSGLGSLSGFSNFDTTAFLKSGSFGDNLNTLLGSQLFKTDPSLLDKNLSLGGQNFSSTGMSSTSSFQNMSSVNNINNMSKNSLVVPAPVVSNVIVNQQNVMSAPIPVQVTHVQGMAQPVMVPAYGNNALIQPREQEKRIVEKKDNDNSKFVDVTPFLTLPQHEAAKKLGIPSSTLAKRWKEASCNRKWPFRTVSKLDKEILTLLKNVENAKAELSPSVEATLGLLLKKRQEELKTVLVRL